ncbi:class II fructose-bisphosphate aldolase [Paenibacillus nasutitermitis]|uniref:Fructose-bisphosphate aldolase n=1 Tax=Paenibacillus nasutitermitis TaxID=1652958 RepID=A0A917DWU0_9BACL|nr:class II fructose-bisphosphate aldolase [Paenibacillus nasutitermitis]GGD77928.1 fructose-bisphosphate aldolase [Paenibacillus nasutitermitis]
MPLVTSKEVLSKAREQGYAVGAFNVFNLESVKAVIAAAEKENAPVMIQVWSGLDTYVGLDVLGAIVQCEAKKAKVPVVLHLDHGMSPEHAAIGIRNGFTSVMIDGSSLPLEDNIAITRDVVRIAHAVGLPVEGEIGHVGGEEGGDNADVDDMIETSIEDAVEFYQRSGVDSLAVSIGTSHGKYNHEPRLNIALLSEIAKQIPIPLVLHGSSYTPEDMIREAIGQGIAKINVATEMSDAIIERTTQAIQQGLQAKYVNDLTYGAYALMTEKIIHKMRLFGSSGKA